LLHPLPYGEGKCNPGINFSIFSQTIFLKHILFFLLLTISYFAEAQIVESIYVNLYTDSLKKGTYNYINIDGKLSTGKFIPLDSTDIIFTSSDGRFSGNSLWIDPDFKKEKVSIKAVLKSDPSMYKEFTMYIKKKPNDEKLKTEEEIMNENKSSAKSKRKRKS
jgi:hypothetical protein